MLLKILLAPLRPTQRQLHGRFTPLTTSRMLRAFIKRHNDVSAQANLHPHGIFRTEEVRRAVKMRTKRHALFIYFAQLVKAENLKATGVGKYGPRPRHKLMQPAKLADNLNSR